MSITHWAAKKKMQPSYCKDQAKWCFSFFYQETKFINFQKEISKQKKINTSPPLFFLTGRTVITYLIQVHAVASGCLLWTRLDWKDILFIILYTLDHHLALKRWLTKHREQKCIFQRQKEFCELQPRNKCAQSCDKALLKGILYGKRGGKTAIISFCVLPR